MDQNEDEARSWPAIVSSAANSKAAEKLADAVHGVVGIGQNLLDYTVGPKRVRAIGEARVAVKLAEGKVDIELTGLRQRAAERLLYKEIRNQENIEAITREAFASLPNGEVPISDAPISEDFVDLFFEESKGVGNEQMQQLWGKLLAGEIVAPGLFHIKTLRVLKDMNPDDARLFYKLCNLSWGIGEGHPIIYNFEDSIYKKNCPNFEEILHLQSLGLINFESLAGYKRTGFDTNLRYKVKYGDFESVIQFGSDVINLGKVIFTEAGRQMFSLSPVAPDPEFFQYILVKWQKEGHKIIFPVIPPAI